jgi:hypothetical protein
MSADAAQYLASAFQKRSGINPSANLGSYILAYNAFRMGYCKMALRGTQDPEEKLRFRNAYLRYREKMIASAQTAIIT